jgi:hypothetical protein
MTLVCKVARSNKSTNNMITVWYDAVKI